MYINPLLTCKYCIIGIFIQKPLMILLFHEQFSTPGIWTLLSVTANYPMRIVHASPIWGVEWTLM